MGTLTKKEQSTRPPKELIERLRAFTTPELCDGAGLYHSMDYQIKPWICRTKIVGPAITVDVPSGEGKSSRSAKTYFMPILIKYPLKIIVLRTCGCPPVLQGFTLYISLKYGKI